MFLQPDLESKLWASDMIQNKDQFTLWISPQAENTNQHLEDGATWEMDGKDNLKISKIKLSKLSPQSKT